MLPWIEIGRPGLRDYSGDMPPPNPKPRAKPTPLHLAVVARILEDVRDGRIAAGARLKELDLAAALGVSRTPVRAALTYLAARGVAERTAGGGVVLKSNGRGVA